MQLPNFGGGGRGVTLLIYMLDSLDASLLECMLLKQRGAIAFSFYEHRRFLCLQLLALRSICSVRVIRVGLELGAWARLGVH